MHSPQVRRAYEEMIRQVCASVIKHHCASAISLTRMFFLQEIAEQTKSSAEEKRKRKEGSVLTMAPFFCFV